MSGRPWRVMVGPDRVRTYSDKATAIGVAVCTVYRKTIGSTGFIEHARTRERVTVVHEPSHIVRVRIWQGRGE